jgi:adenylyltransferase/sulfurtransferase
MRFREIRVQRDPACPICGAHPSIKQLIDYQQFCGISSEMHPDEVSVHDMKKALENPALGIRVIDVREPDEYRAAKVEGTTLLPLSQLAQRFGELDPHQEYYLHCKGGVRSLKALEFLRQQGFGKLKSVAGGILAWSSEIDPKVPKY